MTSVKLNSKEKTSNLVPDISEFILNPSYNKKIDINKDNFRNILDIEFSNENVLLICPYCKEKKEFVLDFKESRDLFKIIKKGYNEVNEEFDDFLYKHVITDRIFERKLKCTTKNCVEYSIYFGVHDCQFYKIWQKSNLPNLK
ncbi:MAG: hypothetical protein JEY94_05480 [Melioribacteraceae bacterium]|nr:hypothetical protein [Melioribacteraceae bacterium]